MLTTIVARRERIGLRDFVFSPDSTTRFLEVVASDERRPDPLQKGNDSRHTQGVLRACGVEYTPRTALPRLVTAQQCLDRLESHAKQR